MAFSARSMWSSFKAVKLPCFLEVRINRRSSYATLPRDCGGAVAFFVKLDDFVLGLPEATPAAKVEDLGALKQSIAERMDAYAADMQAIADSV